MKRFKDLLIKEISKHEQFTVDEGFSTIPSIDVFNNKLRNVYQVPIVDATYPMSADVLSNNFNYYMGKIMNDRLPEIPVNESEEYWFDTKADDIDLTWDKDTVLFSMLKLNHKVSKATNDLVIKYPDMSKELLVTIETLFTKRFEELFRLSNEEEPVYSINVFPDFMNKWKVVVCINIGYPENDDAYGLEGTIFFLTIDPLTLSAGLSNDFPWIEKPIDIWTYAVNPNNITRMISASAMSAIQILVNDVFAELQPDVDERLTLYTKGTQDLSTKEEKIRKFNEELVLAVKRNFPCSNKDVDSFYIDSCACSNGITRIFIGGYIVIDVSIDYGVIVDMGIKPQAVKYSWDKMIYCSKVDDIEKVNPKDHPTYDGLGYEPFYNTKSIEAKSILQDLGDICIEIFRKMEEEKNSSN